MVNDFVSQKLRALSLLAIIAVVFVHTNTAEPRWQMPGTIISGAPDASNFIQFFIANGLARFCIPLFFAISGYLFFVSDKPLTAADFKRKLVNRLSTIVLPFVLWSFIGFILTRLLMHVPFYSASIPWPEVGLDVPGMLKFITYLPLTPISIQFWFLANLFVLALLGYPLYLLLTSRFIYPALGVAAVFWMTGTNLIFSSADGFLFFLLGGFIATRRVDLTYRPGRPLVIGLVIAWIALVAGKTMLSYSFSLLYLHQITVLMGLLAVWFGYDFFISKRMQDRLSSTAEHTFFIYAAHLPFIGITADALIKNASYPAQTGLLAFLLLPPLFVFGLVIVGKTLQRYTPRCYAIVTGGRGTRTVVARTDEGVLANPARN